jgi:hypothetical protein
MITAQYETDSSLGSELPSSVDQSIAERKTSMISGRTDIENRQPGNYRFGDYARVGGPLVAIFLLISLVLIPVIWPF